MLPWGPVGWAWGLPSERGLACNPAAAAARMNTVFNTPVLWIQRYLDNAAAHQELSSMRNRMIAVTAVRGVPMLALGPVHAAKQARCWTIGVSGR